MARLLRLQYGHAVYPVRVRKNERQSISCDDTNRYKFFDLLRRQVEQRQWRCPMA